MALVVMVAAGCTTRAPITPPPTVAATATASPAVESSAPTPSAPMPCPADPVGSTGALQFRTPTPVDALELEGSGTPPDPSEPVTPEVPPIGGTLLGGTPIAVELLLDGQGDGGDEAAITTMTATFVPAGGTVAEPVSIALDGPAATLRLPDRTVDGTLRVWATWTTRCGGGEGSGVVGVHVVASSVAAGCPSDDDGLIALVTALGSKRISVGAVDVPLVVYGWSARWTIGNGVTDFGTLFPTWDPALVVLVAPDEEVVVREDVADLALQTVRAAIYLRNDVDAYLAPDSDEEINVLDVIRRSAGRHGRARIPAPSETGRYVFDLDATWLTPCLEVSTTATVSVEVR